MEICNAIVHSVCDTYAMYIHIPIVTISFEDLSASCLSMPCRLFVQLLGPLLELLLAGGLREVVGMDGTLSCC